MNRVETMELVRSFQIGQLSRRDFLKQATGAVGSVALASMLLTACSQTPNPSAPPVVDDSNSGNEAAESTSSDLVTQDVEYPDLNDETLMGYLAAPTGNGPKAGIIVIQEWWGLNEHIKDVTRRFAQEGYVALAPDLYHGVVTTEPDEARKLVMELDMPKAVSEIQQAMAFLQAQENVARDKIGVVGFCMGGGLVLQTSLVADNMGAGVVFYGRPLEPDQANAVKAPIMTHIGTNDNIPVDAVEALHAAFDGAGVENTLHIYQDAQHAFFNETRASSFSAEASAEAWPRTLDWFASHLGGA